MKGNHAIILLELEMELLSGAVVNTPDFIARMAEKYGIKIDRKTFGGYINALRHFYKNINYFNNVKGWMLE